MPYQDALRSATDAGHMDIIEALLAISDDSGVKFELTDAETALLKRNQLTSRKYEAFLDRKDASSKDMPLSCDMASSTNATTVKYWREGDAVLVNYTGMFVGVLDGWFTWPERSYWGPCTCKLTGAALWPVRVGMRTHKLFPIDKNQIRHGYIVENITLTRKVKIIQRSWRRYRTKRVNSARTIQCVFRQCISNPYHPMCQRRLLHEFTQMAAIPLGLV